MRQEWEDPDAVEAELRAMHGDDVVERWLDSADRSGVQWLAPWLRTCAANYESAQNSEYVAHVNSRGLNHDNA